MMVEMKKVFVVLQESIGNKKMIIEKFFVPISRVKKKELPKVEKKEATKPEPPVHPQLQAWMRKHKRVGK
jgi:hypothetical protein